MQEQEQEPEQEQESKSKISREQERESKSESKSKSKSESKSDSKSDSKSEGARARARERASDACAEGVSHRDVARLATHCSLYIRPLTGHPHAVGLMHSTPSLRCMLHCPFPTNPPHLHSVSPRSPAARPVRPTRPDWRARHMRAECQLSQPRPPRWCTWVRSVRVRSCSARLRRGGTSSLP